MQYEVKEKQNIIDLAIQLYGNAEAIDRLFELNPQLTKRDPAWELADSLEVGSVIYYDDEGADKRVLKELDEKIIISE